MRPGLVRESIHSHPEGQSMRVCYSLLVALVGLGLPVLAEEKADDKKLEKAEFGVEKRSFGKTAGGQAVDLFIVRNDGVTAKLMTYGATLTELHVPDKDGKVADVLLGYDDLAGFESKGNPFFGCTVGRVANRIARGRFTLDGKEYKVAVNNEPNHLHGGVKGFDKVVWRAIPLTGKVPGVRFEYTSPDGDEGYPGTLKASVTYQLFPGGSLQINYSARTDKATPVNLTNHAYFNLAGQGNGDILGHELTLAAQRYTPADDTLIPTGKIEPVKGTPFDFTKPMTIGSRIRELKGDPSGYDVNYVLDSYQEGKPVGTTLALAATVRDPKSGRVMVMKTTEPGVQFYTGNFLDGTIKGKGGAVYQKHAGFCLEAQHFPDSINQKTFPSVVLEPGKEYTQRTVYTFTAK
jgi:aldose 1-epimerase